MDPQTSVTYVSGLTVTYLPDRSRGFAAIARVQQNVVHTPNGFPRRVLAAA